MLVTGVLIRRISPARATAFEVLGMVAEGAYASDALLEKSQALQTRDAGLAAQIAFGCLRFQAQLDFLISHYSGKRTASLDLEVLLALRAGIYQLRYLERVPAHAAVHESVEFVKAHTRSAAGFVNAVLRKVDRSQVDWPDLETRLSCPGWLLDRWTAQFGVETAHRIAEAALREPATYIRAAPRSPLSAQLELEPTEVTGCFRLCSPLPQGVRAQDISSQTIVPLLDLRPDHSYLDLCAAPGNKTLQALEFIVRRAVACDISLRRLRAVPAVCPRVVLDATQPLPFSTVFDRILIDAPCSGTGTLGRNPEIKWRVVPEDFRKFRAKQVKILKRAVAQLAPGGRLVYATCSLEREENEGVVSTVMSVVPGLTKSSEVRRVPGRDEGDGFYAAVLGT